MITKSDFLTYLEAPMHLWAKNHNKLEMTEPTPHMRYLMDQGYEVEKLAESFLENLVTERGAGNVIYHQKIFTDQAFLTRIDAVMYNQEEETWDIFEIKSSTSVRKEHVYDMAFSRLICEATINIRDVYIVNLNKDYKLVGELDISELFVTTNITADVNKSLNEVAGLREDALRIVNQTSPNGIHCCKKPKTCSCPGLCHPGLPEYSIYDLPLLRKEKADSFIAQGIVSMSDIPGDAPLTERQKLHLEAVKTGVPIINETAIRYELADLKYPLFFLDYETYNPGIPRYEGFSAYQHIVFQYSLHILHRIDGALKHIEYLSTRDEKPEVRLLAHLSDRIGDSGSIMVWNRSFEASRNKEMAVRNGSFTSMLQNINERMYDLMEIFRKGYYVHKDFHGSHSIKQVLPVVVPKLIHSYNDLDISAGDVAMATWTEILSGKLTKSEIDNKREALLQYCQLDTLALVEIWRILTKNLLNPDTN